MSFRSGFVTLLGRPNVGKSTLLNSLVGRKISITSRKPQTTRHRILGIVNRETSQIVFVDTPGVHRGRGNAVDKLINRTARSSLEGVNVVVMLIQAQGWHQDDTRVLRLVEQGSQPVVLAINKVDMLKRKESLLPLIEESSDRYAFADIVPISARDGHNLDTLLDLIVSRLPEAPACFPVEQFTDRSVQFMASELVREQLFRRLGEELPYATAVRVERYEERPHGVHIEAQVWVDRESQKAIVIGKGGARLKTIGTQARLAIEKSVGRPVNLKIWVKVRSGWADNQAALSSLGYDEEG